MQRVVLLILLTSHFVWGFSDVEILTIPTYKYTLLESSQGGFSDGTYGYNFYGRESSYTAVPIVGRFNLATFSNYEVLDLTITAPDLKGYSGGFTDGVYGYLVPYKNSLVNHGRLTRFDLSSFGNVNVLDFAATDPDLKGFYDGFLEGSYGYAVPWNNGAAFGKVTRFSLSSFGSFEVLNLESLNSNWRGFNGGFSDGTYGYVVPYGHGDYSSPSGHGNLVRFGLDLFNSATSLNLLSTDWALKLMDGGFADCGRGYGYLMPTWWARVARFRLDTFDTVEVLNLRLIDPTLSGMSGGLTDSTYTYGYVAPRYNTGQFGKVPRFLLSTFELGSVEVLDVPDVTGDPDLVSFKSIFFDRTYAYLSPSARGTTIARFSAVPLTTTTSTTTNSSSTTTHSTRTSSTSTTTNATLTITSSNTLSNTTDTSTTTNATLTITSSSTLSNTTTNINKSTTKFAKLFSLFANKSASSNASSIVTTSHITTNTTSFSYTLSTTATSILSTSNWSHAHTAISNTSTSLNSTSNLASTIISTSITYSLRSTARTSNSRHSGSTSQIASTNMPTSRSTITTTNSLEAIVTTADASSGESMLKLSDVSALSAGMAITISGGGHSEANAIVSVNPDSSRHLSSRRLQPSGVSGMVTLVSPLQYAYPKNTVVEAREVDGEHDVFILGTTSTLSSTTISLSTDVISTVSFRTSTSVNFSTSHDHIIGATSTASQNSGMQAIIISAISVVTLCCCLCCARILYRRVRTPIIGSESINGAAGFESMHYKMRRLSSYESFNDDALTLGNVQDERVHVIWDLDERVQCWFDSNIAIDDSTKEFCDDSWDKLRSTSFACRPAPMPWVNLTKSTSVGSALESANSFVDEQTIRDDYPQEPTLEVEHKPFVENGSVMEFFSLTNQRWLPVEIEVEVQKNDEIANHITYNVAMGKDDLKRCDIDLDYLRRPFVNGDLVEVFSYKSGKRWLAAVIHGVQARSATRFGYRVRLVQQNQVLEMVPAVRLRLRYPPGSRICVYKGSNQGWVNGIVDKAAPPEGVGGDPIRLRGCLCSGDARRSSIGTVDIHQQRPQRRDGTRLKGIADIESLLTYTPRFTHNFSNCELCEELRSGFELWVWVPVICDGLAMVEAFPSYLLRHRSKWLDLPPRTRLTV